MKGLFILAFICFSASCLAQLYVSAPTSIRDTYKTSLYRKKCTDGKCKEGGTGTQLFQSYGELKEYTGTFGEDKTFIQGTLSFLNGDIYVGSFGSFRPDKGSALVQTYDSGTYVKKGQYKYTARFVGDAPQGNVEVIYDNGAIFKGNLKKGYFDGNGQLTYTDGSVYAGEWKEGYRDGFGRMEYANGLVYEGNWVKDHKEGRGFFKNRQLPGYFMAGDFKADYLEGEGKLVLSGSLDTLTGSFTGGHRNGIFQRRSPGGLVKTQYYKSDSLIYTNVVKLDSAYCIDGNCRTGQGKLFIPGKLVYEGDVKDGKAAGQGKIVFESGVVYTGEVRNNKRWGKGKMIFPEKDEYEGDFVNDLKDGQGIYRWADGKTIYTGAWKEGNRQGRGLMVWENGNKYEGDWGNDKIEGEGTFTWQDGSVYSGRWLAGYRDGKGILRNANGQVYDGNYTNGSNAGKGTLTMPNGDKYYSENWQGYAFTKGTFTKNGAADAIDGVYKNNSFYDNREASRMAAEEDRRSKMLTVDQLQSDAVGTVVVVYTGSGGTYAYFVEIHTKGSYTSSALERYAQSHVTSQRSVSSLSFQSATYVPGANGPSVRQQYMSRNNTRVSEVLNLNL